MIFIYVLQTLRALDGLEHLALRFSVTRLHTAYHTVPISLTSSTYHGAVEPFSIICACDGGCRKGRSSLPPSMSTSGIKPRNNTLNIQQSTCNINSKNGFKGYTGKDWELVYFNISIPSRLLARTGHHKNKDT